MQEDCARHRLVFIGGLHRSGTSLVHRLIRAHPDVSGFARTGVPEDEGQHLQKIYPAARAHGGPGRFAFSPQAHLTEANVGLIEACKKGLWDYWAPHWDLSKTVLVEKSPPNLIRARFLRCVFPYARFIFVIRHPLVVAAATRKWSRQSISEGVNHWTRAHQILLEDLQVLENWAWLRYEDLNADPAAVLQTIFDFIALPQIPAAEKLVDSNSRYLSRIEAGDRSEHPSADHLARRFGYAVAPPFYREVPGARRLTVNTIPGLS